MLGLFEALDEINKSIFQHNKVESGNRDPQNPLSPPLKHSPKINPENDFSVFFFTIFNLCSVERRRNNIPKNTPKTPEPQNLQTQAQNSMNQKQKNKKDSRLYKIYDSYGKEHFACVRLDASDFEYDETNPASVFKIKPFSDESNEEPRGVKFVRIYKSEVIKDMIKDPSNFVLV